MGLIQKNAKYNWNLAFKNGSDKKFPSLELVRLESIFLKEEKNSKLLEYGFGSGCNTIFLLEKGYKVVGVDISNYAKIHTQKKIKKKNKKLLKNLSFKILNDKSTKLPFKENSFDFIIALSVLSLLGSETKVNHLLSEFRRILKSNGKIILDINDQNSEFSKGLKKVSKNIFLNIPKDKKLKSFKSYCLPNLKEFSKLVSNYFKIKDSGYSSFKIFKRRINEWIISAVKE